MTLEFLFEPRHAPLKFLTYNQRKRKHSLHQFLVARSKQPQPAARKNRRYRRKRRVAGGAKSATGAAEGASEASHHEKTEETREV